MKHRHLAAASATIVIVVLLSVTVAEGISSRTLGNSFATASLNALAAIRENATRPAAELAKTKAAIENARNKAHTADEIATVLLLNRIQAETEIDNELRQNFKQQLMTASQRTASTLSDSAREQAVSEQMINNGFVRELAQIETTCYSAVASLLRVRQFPGTPGQCKSWLDRRGEAAVRSSNVVAHNPATAQGASAPKPSESANSSSPGPSTRNEPANAINSSRTNSDQQEKGGFSVASRLLAAVGAVKQFVVSAADGILSTITGSDEPSQPSAQPSAAWSRTQGWLTRVYSAVIEKWWMFPAGVVPLLALAAWQLRRPRLKGRLVIEHSGARAAEIEFRRFKATSFLVKETCGPTRATQNELDLYTGHVSRLFKLEMRRVDRQWRPVIEPLDARLSANGRYLANDVMPESKWVSIDGTPLRVMYYV
ncbi:MAG: hypothetical protein ACR2IF_04670 [Terriglobales bacterium]